MKKNVFLIDANAFLTPSKQYYRFSIAPSYWKKINYYAEQGYIKTIDKVTKEVCSRKEEKKKDEIQIWYENEFKGEIISTNNQKIIDEYVNIINYLNDSEKYSHLAFLEWSRNVDIADPWLIATAKTYDYVVVTFEKKKNYNGGTPMSSAKIPNVCEDLKVKYTDLFSMIEELNIKL